MNPYTPLEPTEPMDAPVKQGVHATTWLALGTAIVAMIFVINGDNAPIITASSPLQTGLVLGLAAVVLGVIGAGKGARTWAVVAIVIAGLAVVIATHDLVLVQHKMDELHRCLNDLIACGQENQQ